jgi:copper homeostasis protein
MSFTLEICCYDYQSCINAEQGGADRIELCADSAAGGTTPGYGVLKLVRENIRIRVFPIIRPRGGDFFYSDEEFRVMKKEVVLCREMGFPGVVFGILKQDGSVDKERCGDLVALAGPMQTTFHRAFDRALNPFEAMEDIIQIGCKRILTSGHKPMAMEGAALLQDLVRQANERIVVMPGSGIRADNIIELVKKTGASEYHSSASVTASSAMFFVNQDMQENLGHIIADRAQVKEMKEALVAYSRQEH